VHDVEVAPLEQGAQARGPAQVEVAARAERVDEHVGLLEVGDERVALVEDVGDLVVEARPVALAHHVEQQSFRAPVAHALDEEQHAATGRCCDARAVDVELLHEASVAPRPTLRHAG